MGALFGVLGFFGIVFCVIWFIVRLINKKPKRPILWTFLICFVLMIVGFATTSKSEDVDADDLSDEASAILSEADSLNSSNESSTSERKNDDRSPEDAIAVLEPALEKYGDSYNILVDDNIVMISVWYDGLMFEAEAAKNGDEDLRKQWDLIREAAISEQGAYQQIVRDAGFDNVVIVYAIANDLNHDSILLSVSMNTIVLDYVDGTNLLNIG